MIIAVSAWSFHTELYNGKLHLSEVPFRTYDLGFRAVELLDMFLWPRPPNRLARWLGRRAPTFNPHEYDRATLLQVKMNRLRSGTQLVAWGVASDLTAEGEAAVAQRAYLARAIETARWLNAPILRLTLGGAAGDGAAYARSVDILSTVLPVAIASGVKLAIENHGGLSGEAGTLVELVGHFHSPQLGVCLDFGNFAEPTRARQSIEQLAPHTLHVHAKSRVFRADGEEAEIDYRACLSALKAAQYDGAISIEYEGDGDAAAGIRKTRDLIQKYWG